MYKIKNVTPEYTGGGIWIYSGEVEGDKWFLTSDDYPLVCILDVDPFDEQYEDDFTFEEWQVAHRIEDITGDGAVEFWRQMLSVIQPINGMRPLTIEVRKDFVNVNENWIKSFER